MSINHRINNGTWPSSDPLPGGLVRNGLVCAYDPGVYKDMRNLCANPADGSAASTYDMTLGPYSEIRGTAGRKSAGDYFRITGGSVSVEGRTTNASYNQAGYAYMPASPTPFVNSMHQTTANWTVAFVAYLPADLQETPPVFSTGTSWGTGTPGLYILHEGGAGLRVGTSVSGGTFNDTHWKGPGQVRWNFQAASLQGNVSLITYANGVLMEQLSSSSTSYVPNMTGNGTASATQMRLGSVSNAYWSVCGHRIGQFFIWNRPLSKAELDQCFEAVRRRWGI